VAADVRVDVEDYEIVRGAMDDVLAFVIALAFQHRAENARRRLLLFTA
jgi:hypothetical protein